MQSTKTCVPYIFEKLHKKTAKNCKTAAEKCKKAAVQANNIPR